MTIDERVSRDLAVVAVVSRERPIPVEATLRRVGAVVTAPATAATSSAHAMLAMSRIYANRIARIAGGCAAVVCTVLLLVVARLADYDYDWRDPPFFDQVLWISHVWIDVAALLVVSGIATIASRRARLRFEHLARSHDVETVARLVRDRDVPAVVLSIAGVMSFTLFVGMMTVMVGTEGLHAWFIGPGSLAAEHLRIANWTVVFLIVAIAGSILAALAVARGPMLPARWQLIVGIAITMGTSVIGFRYDAGPLPFVLPSASSLLLLRGCLTAAGTLGLFLIVTNRVLATRAREQRELC